MQFWRLNQLFAEGNSYRTRILERTQEALSRAGSEGFVALVHIYGPDFGGGLRKLEQHYTLDPGAPAPPEPDRLVTAIYSTLHGEYQEGAEGDLLIRWVREDRPGHEVAPEVRVRNVIFGDLPDYDNPEDEVHDDDPEYDHPAGSYHMPAIARSPQLPSRDARSYVDPGELSVQEVANRHDAGIWLRHFKASDIAREGTWEKMFQGQARNNEMFAFMALRSQELLAYQNQQLLSAILAGRGPGMQPPEPPVRSAMTKFGEVGQMAATIYDMGRKFGLVGGKKKKKAGGAPNRQVQPGAQPSGALPSSSFLEQDFGASAFGGPTYVPPSMSEVEGPPQFPGLNPPAAPTGPRPGRGPDGLPPHDLQQPAGPTAPRAPAPPAPRSGPMSRTDLMELLRQQDPEDLRAIAPDLVETFEPGMGDTVRGFLGSSDEDDYDNDDDYDDDDDDFGLPD